MILDLEGEMRIEARICVSKVDNLAGLILEEAYYSRYFIHSGGIKCTLI